MLMIRTNIKCDNLNFTEHEFHINCIFYILKLMRKRKRGLVSTPAPLPRAREELFLFFLYLCIYFVINIPSVTNNNLMLIINT